MCSRMRAEVSGSLREGLLFTVGMANQGQGQTRPTAAPLAAFRRKCLPVLPPLEALQGMEGEAGFQDRAWNRRGSAGCSFLLWACESLCSFGWSPKARTVRQLGRSA